MFNIIFGSFTTDMVQLDSASDTSRETHRLYHTNSKYVQPFVNRVGTHQHTQQSIKTERNKHGDHSIMNRQTREFCDECWTEFATAAAVMRHMEKCIFDETVRIPEENNCCRSMLENALY